MGTRLGEVVTGEVGFSPLSLVVSIIISGLASVAVGYLYWKLTGPHGKGKR